MRFPRAPNRNLLQRVQRGSKDLDQGLIRRLNP